VTGRVAALVYVVWCGKLDAWSTCLPVHLNLSRIVSKFI